MTLQDAVGVAAAGLALGLVLTTAWIEWSPSVADSDAMPQVAASMPEAEANADPNPEPHSCEVADTDATGVNPFGGTGSLQHAYCPISSP